MHVRSNPDSGADRKRIDSGSSPVLSGHSVLRLSGGPGGGFDAAPEPSTWAAGLIGAVTLGLMARRKRIPA
jgi:hypothetical protein